ncbi:hypothetical protein NDU88_006364 [Pleurodeles waltl]|uniref:Uncharacterized protein n=1 Tax=Pleurodeles waltl TaxID=8319 RepID=A0AAV7NRL4_PLEWA|nr:hypothetical protein NDU88_006364 [Pleurodeles waltl]
MLAFALGAGSGPFRASEGGLAIVGRSEERYGIAASFSAGAPRRARAGGRCPAWHGPRASRARQVFTPPNMGAAMPMLNSLPGGVAQRAGVLLRRGALRQLEASSPSPWCWR